MPSELEQRMSRRNLEAFVKAEEVEIVLHRQTETKTPAGGVKKGPVQVLPPQRGRLVPFKRRYSAMVQDTQYGDIPELQYILVMTDPDRADIRRYDWFVWQGDTFDVQSVDIKRGVRIAAELLWRGSPSG